MVRNRLLLSALVILLPLAGFGADRQGRDQWQQRDRVLKDLNLSPGDAIGDIGCGSGYFTFHLAKEVGEAGIVYATEISEKALKKVKDKVETEQLQNIKPVLSDPTTQYAAE